MNHYQINSKGILLFVLLIGLTSSSLLYAQDITGKWHGKLKLPMASLTIVFHISRTEQGDYLTLLDSPDQNAFGTKTASTTFVDSVLTIQIPVINASYRGQLSTEKSITGVFTQGAILPLNLEKGEPSKPKRPQEPQPPFPYKSEEVSVMNKADGITLAGTLTLPSKGHKFPAVVLVTGSGAQNRDEEFSGHKPFFVIADYLTRNGIAVLRCDDRGTALSQGNYAAATNEEFVRDTEAALEYLRSRKDINVRKIGIIGHSCGGTIAFCTGAKDGDVSFIVSLAGAALRGDSVMLKQAELTFKSKGMTDVAWQPLKPILRQRYSILRQADKSVSDIRQELYADVTRTVPPESLKDLNIMQRVTAEINSMTSPWYLHFMRFDPTEDLRKVKCPVLALNGEKDIQVDATMNLTAIRERIAENGNKNVTVKTYPQLNHFFQTCRQCTLEEYGELEETIHPEVLKDLTEWILNLIGNSRK